MVLSSGPLLDQVRVCRFTDRAASLSFKPAGAGGACCFGAGLGAGAKSAFIESPMRFDLLSTVNTLTLTICPVLTASEGSLLSPQVCSERLQTFLTRNGSLGSAPGLVRQIPSLTSLSASTCQIFQNTCLVTWLIWCQRLHAFCSKHIFPMAK